MLAVIIIGLIFLTTYIFYMAIVFQKLRFGEYINKKDFKLSLIPFYAWVKRYKEDYRDLDD